jgi:two-component system, sensor histidine kinase
VASGAAEDLARPEVKPCRVLLVEDGSVNRKLISIMLRTAGIDVTTAENGQVGVQLATTSFFDVILMDMQMPVMDGYTAARTLRDVGMRVPIVALTAHALAEDRQKCLRAGCSGYLSKPIRSHDLLRAIADALASAADPLGECAVPLPREETAARPAPGGRTTTTGEEEPLVSTLPMDDPDFREIAEEFVEYFAGQLNVLRQAFAAEDWPVMASVAHALKGTAGGAGFDVLTNPIKDLESLARNKRQDQVPAALQVLEQLARRMVVPVAS